MARLFLIRHGQPAQTWGGADADPGLSDAGHAQARAAAEALAEFGPLQLISSPMLRCRETAAPYASMRAVAPVIEPRISEIVSGEGVSDRAAWLQARFPWRDPNARRAWGSLEPRLQAWRAEMLNYIGAFQYDAVLFSHFIAINVIAGAALGRSETIVCKPAHASITEIEVHDGTLKLVRFGAEMQVDDVR